MVGLAECISRLSLFGRFVNWLELMGRGRKTREACWVAGR